MNVSQAKSAKEGGGGAIYAFSTVLWLDRVRIVNCIAGKKGGGGIMLNGGSTTELFGGCSLSNNRAIQGFGGNMHVSSSMLIINGAPVKDVQVCQLCAR